MKEMRLQKFLAEAGIASRRKCEELINQGRVKIDGNIAKIGDKIKSENDKVSLDGKQIKLQEKKIYILLNKPLGYVTTAKDQFNRDTVMNLVQVKERVVPVRKARYVYVRSTYLE